MARMLRFLSPLFLGWLAILAALTAALGAASCLPRSTWRARLYFSALVQYHPALAAMLLLLAGFLLWHHLNTALALGGRREDFYRASRLGSLGLTLAAWGLLRVAAALLPGELPASWAILTSAAWPVFVLALLSMVSLGSLMGALAYRYGHPLAAGGLTLLTAVGAGYDLFPLLTGAISVGDEAELISAALWAAVLLAAGELVSWSSMRSYRVM